jgi:salicylate hydroxylase
MRVVVVGGGLAGLGAAAFLLRAGVDDVRVFERSPALGEIGAGIQVPPNAVRLMHRLGIREALDRAGVRMETGWDMRRWEDGRVLFSQDLGSACEERFGAPYYVAHRAGLLEALRAVLPEGVVQLGHRCVGVEQDGDEARMMFAGGETVAADVVIGADGIHSVVRDAVTTPSPPTFSGTAAYRCLIPARDADPMALEPGFKVWMGPGRHLVHYPVSGGREVNVVGIVPAGEWRTESWISEGTVDGFRAAYAGWAPQVQALLDRAPSAYLYALYDREPLQRIVRGRVALVGDAAHPMLPFLAQGAAQAFEDGAALALCLRDGDPEAGVARYERVRLQRVSEVQRASRGRPEVYHLPDGPEQRRRDAELAAEDRLGHASWLYAYDAEAAVRDPGVPAA